MTAEREAMTLEQVRDFCRLQSKEFGYWHEQRQFEKMADAIDRYLSRAAERDELTKSRIGLCGGHRVALEDMANTPESRQTLRDLLILMERMEAHDRQKGIPPECEPDEPKATHPPEPARDAKEWLAISELPNDARLVLAVCADRRCMIWRADFLTRNLRGPTPNQLQFPAIKFRALNPLVDAAMAQESGE